MWRVTQLAVVLVALVAGYTLSSSARAGPREVSADVAAGLYGGSACDLNKLPEPTYWWCVKPAQSDCGYVFTIWEPGNTHVGEPKPCTDMCPYNQPKNVVKCGSSG
jgi:hypothetical protein